jgi:hypothetical protein
MLPPPLPPRHASACVSPLLLLSLSLAVIPFLPHTPQGLGGSVDGARDVLKEAGHARAAAFLAEHGAAGGRVRGGGGGGWFFLCVDLSSVNSGLTPVVQSLGAADLEQRGLHDVAAYLDVRLLISLSLSLASLTHTQQFGRGTFPLVTGVSLGDRVIHAAGLDAAMARIDRLLTSVAQCALHQPRGRHGRRWGLMILV